MGMEVMGVSRDELEVQVRKGAGRVGTESMEECLAEYTFVEAEADPAGFAALRTDCRENATVGMVQACAPDRDVEKIIEDSATYAMAESVRVCKKANCVDADGDAQECTT